MAKNRINVYTNMDNIKENATFNAICNKNVIKYLDSVNNKVVVDCNKNILTKENGEYFIKIDFNKNIITIFMKEYQQEFIKEIKTLVINNDNNLYSVKYKLIDENVVNEYEIKFL